MRSSLKLLSLSALLVSCGGKVIFDTASGTGGIGGAANTTSVVTGTTSKATTTTNVGTAVATVGSTVATSVATGPGVCTDPGPPPGSTIGLGDCGGKVCTNASCAEACSALYDCGLAVCGTAGGQLCPGFGHNPAQHDGFAAGMGGCIQSCGQQPAIKGIIDPTQCDQTIQALKGVSNAFKNYCEGAVGG